MPYKRSTTMSSVFNISISTPNSALASNKLSLQKLNLLSDLLLTN